MISGATGAVAVVLLSLSISHGPEYVFATVILTGIIEILAGIFRLGKLIRLAPQSVIFGFVNGLAIIIFMAQLSNFKYTNEAGELIWMSGENLYILIDLVLVTMVTIWGLPKITKAFPSSLAAILVVFGIVVFFGIETKTVGDLANIDGGFPPFHIPMVPFSFETLGIIFPYAMIFMEVALVESLLTLNIIDEITETRGRGNKKCVAQGTANIFSGFFSGMGGCAMIGQSLINVTSEARARLSGITAAVMLLIFIMFAADIIELLPMAALTGVMFKVAIGAFEWASFRTFRRTPKSDVLVMALVTGVTVVLHNLALAF